jgi:hypothetical protein
MKWTRHVALMGEMTNTQNISVRKPEGKGRERLRHLNIKENITLKRVEMGLQGENWKQLALDTGPKRAVVNTVMNL